MVCYLINILVTAIMFLVRVPVLSEQMLSAPPIVSQACKYLTKLFSYLIFPTLYARAIVTANGRPSGTATTMMLTAMMNASTNSWRVSNLKRVLTNYPEANAPYKIWPNMQIKVAPAETIPTWPICSAKTVNFCWSGVYYYSDWRTSFSFPYWEWTPVAKTIIAPVPSKIFDPEIRKELPFLCYLLLKSGTNFLIPSGSPVIADSSATMLWLSTTNPSTEIIYPVSTNWISPTNMS